jgi:glycosyltransferase involved in cell wall biosynthesis
MNILYIVSGFAPAWGLGGGVRTSYELSKEMASRGHDIVVYTTDILDHKSRINYRYKNWEGVKTYYFKTISNYLAKKQFNFAPKIMYYLMRNISSFNIVHIHEYRTVNCTLTAYFAKKKGIPYIIQAHGSVSTTVGMIKLKKLYDLLIGHKILKNASKLIALNEMEVGQYLEMGVDENQIEVVPNGINVSDFENLPTKGVFKKRYGIREDEKVILFLGRINKIKGVDLLVSAFSNLTQKFKDTKLVIVGPDDGFRNILEKQIRDLNIENSVLFTGPLYEQYKLEAYVDADVYVLPSVYDMFPNTVFEACGCCTPVILTNRCGIADYIRDEAGIVVEYDKDQLCNALSIFLDNDELSKKFGKKGKTLIFNRYNWNQIAEEMEQVYESL